MPKRKRTKPATKTQEKARERNWNKGKMICIVTMAQKIKKAKTTPLNEKLALGDIIYRVEKILENWNKGKK